MNSPNLLICRELLRLRIRVGDQGSGASNSIGATSEPVSGPRTAAMAACQPSILSRHRGAARAAGGCHRHHDNHVGRRVDCVLLNLFYVSSSPTALWHLREIVLSEPHSERRNKPSHPCGGQNLQQIRRSCCSVLPDRLRTIQRPNCQLNQLDRATFFARSHGSIERSPDQTT